MEYFLIGEKAYKRENKNKLRYKKKSIIFKLGKIGCWVGASSPVIVLCDLFRPQPLCIILYVCFGCLLLCNAMQFSSCCEYELFIVQVTILVAAEGSYKLPTINGSGDLKEALQNIGSIPSSRTLVSKSKDRQAGRQPAGYDFHFHFVTNLSSLQAVEVLWTPQNENDTLSERQLLEDYPLLRPL